MKMSNTPVQTGIDIFEKHWPKKLKDSRVGLLMHTASVNKRLEHAIDLFKKSKKFQLTTLFGPQHGIYGEMQDNMVEWEGFLDPRTGLPVFSLYGHTRKPESSMFDHIDVLAIDLQDVGSRYYTFIWTMDNCMRACMEMNKSLVILDRPNPIGGHITEGPVSEMAYSSFVGQRPLPIRHGMTIGEIGNYLYNEFYTTLDFHIIPMKGWRRNMWFDNTSLPWVIPSPNMPTLETATVYPGMCLLEGTNISEGRGTTRPFEIFGAPYIDSDLLVEYLKKFRLPGVLFRPMYFHPTFQKYAGKLCGGAQIHITDRERFRPFKTGVAVLKAVHDLYLEHFTWRPPPYEYETEKMPIDILAGTDRLRRDIENGEDLEKMEDRWQEQCYQFDRKYRKRYLIYKR
jgi:uncharacterized protein YbbC (DUF1343 family)